MKTLKTLLPVFLLFFIRHTIVIAQNGNPCIGAGVYLTYDDFINNKISYAINYNEPNNHLWVGGFFPFSDVLKIKTPDTAYTPGHPFRYYKKRKFKPGTIWGYYKQGYKFRFYDAKWWISPHSYFTIRESDSLTIYSQLMSHSHNTDTHYYYSIGANAPIKPLYEKNLVSDFSAYPEFVEKIKEMNKGWKGSLISKNNEGHYNLILYYNQFVKKKN